MMPTIRVDDDVFDGLKKLAEPFVDTPSAVIRRLLLEKGVLKSTPEQGKSSVVVKRTRTENPASTTNQTTELTPQHIYEQFLLVTLEKEFDGTGDKRSVTKAVINRMVSQGFISTRDLELVATGETKAENTIAWGRNALKDRGLISRISRRGVWELTAEGRIAATGTELPKPPKR